MPPQPRRETVARLSGGKAGDECGHARTSPIALILAIKS
jgi:hypothetical protein